MTTSEMLELIIVLMFCCFLVFTGFAWGYNRAEAKAKKEKDELHKKSHNKNSSL